MANTTKNTACKVHNVRFYNPKPLAVYCMAVHPDKTKIALSRSNANIEIWNLKDAPFIERTITSTSENFSIEGLAWSNERLFSVGLHGLLIEYNLFGLGIKNKAVVTGEAAFCLDVNRSNTQIAVGTEQGYLNIFSLEHDAEEFYFVKFLDKQEGRILCLKYDHSGEFVVSGSLDAIRIWNVQTGHALFKMTTGRSEAKKPTIVWCLAVTKDLTIISGDSRGKLAFWDGKNGSQIESYQSHRADILSLCLSEDENSLYCAGIDPIITNYVKINTNDTRKCQWVKSRQRKVHSHDVRALALITMHNKEKLYSSGIDGYFACSFYPPKTLLQYPPILQGPIVSISAEKRLILLRYPDFVEVRTLGVASRGEGNALTLDGEPKRLLVLQKALGHGDLKDRKEGVICAAISQDGRFICYGTSLGVGIFKLNYNPGVDEKPELVPLDFLDGDDVVQGESCVNVVFASANSLILAPSRGGLKVVGFDGDHPVLNQSINTETEIKDTITFLTSSGDFLVAGDPRGNFAVWKLKQTLKQNRINDGMTSYEFYTKLPGNKSPPTALAISPNGASLVVTYADSSLLEYNLPTRQLSNVLTIAPRKTSCHFPIRNITFDPRCEDVIILHDDSNIVVINKNKKKAKQGTPEPKIAKMAENNNKTGQVVFKTIDKYKHLLHLEWLVGNGENDEMVAVEVNPLRLWEQMPPSYPLLNTFGRK